VADFQLRGDLGKIRTLCLRLKRPARALRALSKDFAEESLNLIDKGFKAGADPYGRAWGAPNNLQIKGDLSNYGYSDVSETGFTVHATDPKAIWHHAPRPRKRWRGKALPTRLQVPTAGRGLPRKWRERYQEVAKDFLEEWLSG